VEGAHASAPPPVGMTPDEGRAPRAVSRSATDTFPIVIDDPQGCARYTARVIRNVKIVRRPSTSSSAWRCWDRVPSTMLRMRQTMR